MTERRYFRMTERTGHWWSGGSRSTYEVRTTAGTSMRVSLDALPAALGLPPDSGRDWQECEMTARRLFEAGKRDLWVEYPTAHPLP